jgi:hypothetical protein
LSKPEPKPLNKPHGKPCSAASRAKSDHMAA